MSDQKLRGGHRAVATTLLTKIEDLIQTTEIDESALKATIIELKRQKEKIILYDDRIQMTLDDDDLGKDMVESSRRILLIEKGLTMAEDCLASINLERSHNLNSTRNFTYNSGVKLPTINLPKFSGNPVDWSHFWDIFNNSIHIRTDIADAQKFAYLTGQLEGEAADLLEGLTTSDANYVEAVRLLNETYGDPKRIIQSHLHSLFDLKGPGNNASDLSRFRSSFECHLRGLKALDTKVEEAGFVFVALLLRKLPPRIRDSINRSAKSNYWTLQEFRKAIGEEILLLQAVEPKDQTTKSKISSVSKGNYKPSLKTKSTVSNFNINANEKLSTTPLCRLCFNKHHVKDCEEYKTPKGKVDRAKNLNLCHKCLMNTHITKKCFSSIWCKKCQGQHNTIFCMKGESKDNDAEKVTASVATSQEKFGVVLPTAMVELQGNTSTQRVRALLDQGSQRTFLCRAVAKELGLEPKGRIKLAIDELSTEGKLKLYHYVEVKLLGKGTIFKMRAILIDSLPSRVKAPGLTKAVQSLEELNIELADPKIENDHVGDIAMLIGCDYYFDIVQGFSVYNNVNIIHSYLGNMIAGRLPINTREAQTSCKVTTVLKISENEHSLEKTLEKFWSLESVGINPKDLSNTESEACEKFKKSLKIEDGRYVVSLPWKNNTPPLHNNFSLAKNRLYATVKQLKTNSLLQIYDDLIKEQLQRGFIEEVKDLYSPNAYYLPHFAVRRSSTTTPVRIVFDCSSGKPSLNDCLLKGPPLVNDLCQTILRFRLFKYACLSDIEKAFLNIGLNREDRDFTRFLWLRDPKDLCSPLMVYRFKVVLFGATCSPFLLNASIQNHLTNRDSPISSAILNGLYVDNVVYTHNDENEMFNFYTESKLLLAEIGLNLREWISNSESLNKMIGLNKDGVINSDEVKILGITWNHRKDILTFPKFRTNPSAGTKRTILQNIAGIFDPLGHLLPVTIGARIFMQTLWKSKIGWDECISTQKQDEWRGISSNINKSILTSIPRQITTSSKIILHAFSDASSKAYGTAVYAISEDGSRLIMAKAKVAPMKTLTIPQLELTAAVLSVRLVKFIINAYKNLNIENIHFWVDSKVVISWIESSKVLKPYVQNRIDEIREMFPKERWRFTPTSDNPSDLLTRGITAKRINSELWLTGPSWLRDESKWPEQSIVAETNLLTLTDKETSDPSPIFDLENMKLSRILKITALVRRFVFKLKGQNSRNTLITNEGMYHDISSTEFREAERYWIKYIQLSCFKNEIDSLKDKDNFTNLVKQLNLFLDEDGILRCRSRLDYSHLSYEVKFPVLLPRKHSFTVSIINDYHYKFHPGINQMVASIRQRWWFSRMRQTIKSVIKPCVTCNKVTGRRYKIPPVPPLPRDRLTEAQPFTITGLDYSGALFVKNGKVGKVYILLFTCATTRAVHLELVEELASESFFRALRRFISRRTTPNCIYCDNAPTFVKVGKFFKEIYRSINLRELPFQKKIEWKFIPSKGPWFGGFYERLIGLTKNCLKKILGKALVNRDELHTILTEIERSLNERPLTYSSDNLDDLSPLTPAQLLYGYQQSEGTDISAYENINEQTFFSRRQKYITKIKMHFWERWRKEYVTSLRHYYYSSRGLTPVVGDVVQIKEELPRSKWKLGKITGLFTGKDGYARSAEIQTNTGKIVRPVAKLYPLEIRDTIDDGNITTQTRRSARIAERVDKH